MKKEKPTLEIRILPAAEVQEYVADTIKDLEYRMDHTRHPARQRDVERHLRMFVSIKHYVGLAVASGYNLNMKA